MATEKKPKSLLKRIKSFIITILLIAVIVQGVVLYRLYKVHVDAPEITTNEAGEARQTPADFQQKVKRLRGAFTDASANAWAEAQKSDDPENAWFNIGYRPRADVRDQGQSYLVSVDVPGVKQEELSINLSGLTLTVTGVRNRSSNSGEVLIRERFRGEFSRTFKLPGGVSGEEITASLGNGILRVAIPKGELDDLDIPIKISSGSVIRQMLR